MTGDDPTAPAALGERVAALEARVQRLASLVESLLAERPGGEEPWRRLGLTEGERRIVTVLFADVSGFTALSEQLDPEAFQLVMRDTMSLLASCVTAEGGTVEKFIGDALCALFGAPVAHPDEPERAARAALAMHRALAERAAARPDLPALQVHAGINTGPVIAGAVGDGSQFGVMGDTINAAARLMGLASDGETFVSAASARRLRHGFRLEDRGLHEVKGKAQPLAVLALLDELGPGERAEAGRLEAPLVGRARELAQLREIAGRVAAGDGTTVVLRGDDGAGTSRLAREVAAELGGAGWRVLQASSRVQAETPLGLVAAALGPLLAERAGELAGGTSGPLAETLLAGSAVAPHDFELVLGEVVAAAARESPLVVVLDDADDADAGSIEVVRYLSRTTGDERVLWILTGNRVPASFATGDLVVVTVGPLPDTAVAEVFDALFPGALTAAQRQRLAHLADGNVQYALEIALALVDDGLVAATADGAWMAVGDVDACELPGSVAELVEARIDRLSTAARVTLQDASVIGLRFGRALLERVATIPTSVDAALAELVDEELVVPGELWSFRSRLVRDVSYESILRRRRPAAHRAVAEALLALEPDRVADNADLLAHHLEASDEPVLAVPHLLEAIARAEQAYNLTGALERGRRALRLRDRFPGRVTDADTVALLKRVGINRLLLGDPGGVEELGEAVALLGAAGAPATEVASLEERVGWYLAANGDRDAAASHLARAGDHPGVAVTRALLDGDMAAADAARGSTDPFVAARAWMVGGALRLRADAAAEAVEHLQAALELARAHDFGTIADRCGRWLAAALVAAGRGEEAEELARPILARVDDRGDPTVAAGVRAALAQHRLAVGDLAGAAEVTAEAEAIVAERQVAPDAAEAVRAVAQALASTVRR